MKNSKLTTNLDRKRLTVILFAAVLLAGCDTPEEQAKKIAAINAQSAATVKRIEAAEREKKYLADAYKSRDEFDAATRDNTADRRKRLETASTGHTMSNKHGVRIDRYRLKDGRTVVCTTTVPAAGPAVFDCDGEP